MDEEGKNAPPIEENPMTMTTIQNDGTSMASTMTTGTTVGKINVAEQRAKVEAQFSSLITGIDTLLTDVTTFLIGDQQILKPQVVSRLQARIDAAERTKAVRLALHAAVAAEALTVADTNPLRADLKTYCQGRYGKTSPKMQLFGFTQAKVPQKSAVAAAKGVAKAKATRAAIGTKGKKQRKAAAAAIVAPVPAGPPVTNGGK